MQFDYKGIRGAGGGIDDETWVEKVERPDWMQIPIHASRFSLQTSNRLKILGFLGHLAVV